MLEDGRLVGCMVHNDSLYFWLTRRAGAPERPEHYVTDEDGSSHTFGVATAGVRNA
jgi:hypothetical protein